MPPNPAFCTPKNDPSLTTRKDLSQGSSIASLPYLGVGFLWCPKSQSQVPSKPSAPLLQRDVTRNNARGMSRRETRGRRQATPGPLWLRLHRAGVASILTGNCFLIADAFVKAAPQLLAAISGDVVVTYVVQRNVAHCQAQTHTEQLSPRTQPRAGNSIERGTWRGNSWVCVVGFVMFLIMHHTNLTLKLRSGMN